MDKPIVAIVGKPNVGKSTLFNRISGKRIAIVDETPGTTRDRIYTDISWHGHNFILADTGGLVTGTTSNMTRKIREQAEVAIKEADIVIFLVDVRDGITPVDLDIADILRRSKKRVLLVINKADTRDLESAASQFYQLGITDYVMISAYHNIGINDLMDKITTELPTESAVASQIQSKMPRITLVGRPGVGKSLLLNTLLGESRAIVGETPGTTRDTIDTTINMEDQDILIVDTAGVKRRGHLERGIETYSVMRTMEAIQQSNVALLVIDATEPFTAQDLHIAGYILEAYCAMVVIVNKWDLIEQHNTAQWIAMVRQRVRFLPKVPVLFVSAKTGYGTDKILPAAKKVYEEGAKRIPTAELNRVIEEAIAEHPTPLRGSRQLKIFYVTQSEVNPPTFVFFVNDGKLLHFSYRRYLENKLREAFGFDGNPLRMIFRNRDGAESDN